MTVVSMNYLLEAGVHFGHQRRRWNPKMKEYIYTSRDDIYIIDLQKTSKLIEEAYEALKQIVEQGGTVLFVGTKKQAADAVAEEAVAEKAEEEVAEEKSNVVAFKKAEESAVESETTETAEETTVVEATGTEPVQKPEQPAGGNRPRKKNRKKSRTNRNQNRVQEAKKEAPAPEEIWDDEKNIDEEVAELYKQGFGIMEIANQLGIGVGETKVIIKNIENQKQ